MTKDEGVDKRSTMTAKGSANRSTKEVVWGSQRTADRLHQSNRKTREMLGRQDRAMRVDVLWVRRRNVRKERKETWEYKGRYIYWSSRGGSVRDGTSENKRERRQGSVRGNRDQQIRVFKKEATSSRKVLEQRRRNRVHGYCPRGNVMTSWSGGEEQKEKQGRVGVQRGQ